MSDVCEDLFVQIQQALDGETHIKRSDLATLLAIYRSANNGLAEVSVAEISRRADICLRSAKAALKRLRDYKLINCVRRGTGKGRPSQYEIAERVQNVARINGHRVHFPRTGEFCAQKRPSRMRTGAKPTGATGAKCTGCTSAHRGRAKSINQRSSETYVSDDLDDSNNKKKILSERSDTERKLSAHSGMSDATDAFSHFCKVADELATRFKMRIWVKPAGLNEGARKALAGRIRQAGGLEAWKRIIDRLAQLAFTTIRTARNWPDKFSWLLKRANFTKASGDRFYDRAEPAPVQQTGSAVRASDGRSLHDLTAEELHTERLKIAADGINNRALRPVGRDWNAAMATELLQRGLTTFQQLAYADPDIAAELRGAA